MTTWNTMTLRQFQAIVKIQFSKMDDIDKQTEILSILTGKTPRQLDAMPLTDYKVLAARATALLKGIEKMPGKVEKHIAGFAIPYDVRAMNQGQWVTLMHFTQGLDTISKQMDAAHLILATIAKPTKRTLLGRMAQPNDPTKHAEYAEAFLDAPVISVYHSCLFFCRMFRDFLESIQGYLAKQLVEKGANPRTALETIRASIRSMDGFIAQNKLLSSTA